MLALILALGASVGWGGADFLGGTSARRLNVLTVAFASQLVGLAFAFGLTAIGGSPLAERTVVLGLLGGCLGRSGSRRCTRRSRSDPWAWWRRWCPFR